MIRAIDAANFFISLFGCFEEDNDLTNMKINKLLYYAQGHSYERFNKPLFNDDIEAWENGPVINGVYQNLKQYSNNTVSAVIGDYNPNVFSSEESELLLDIAREYGKYSASTLRNMTHANGTPWKNSFDGSYHKQIPQEDIAKYFMSNGTLSSFECNSEIETIGRTENGCLILPKEELDDWDY